MNAENAAGDYVAACEAVARDFVERATRYGAADLELLEATASIHHFTATISHCLEVVSEWSRHTGKHAPGENDFGTADWAWYQEQDEAQVAAEASRLETLDELIGRVKAEPFGTISRRTQIRQHPRRLFHTYVCSTCHGSGHITCQPCGGSGSDTCGRCSGRGKTSCGSCGGSGTVQETHQVRDYSGHYRSETRTRSCYNCFGGRVTCSGCGGSGRVTCRTCHGTGTLTCDTCSGHGCLTRVTVTNTYTTPEISVRFLDGAPSYLAEVVHRFGLLNIEKYGTVRPLDIGEYPEERQAYFNYDLALPCCELVVLAGGRRSNWILFGALPQIHDSGGVVEALLEADQARLGALLQSNAWSRPWFHRRAMTTSVPFMESEVHQEVLDADAQKLNTADIHDKIHRSLSMAHIESSLARLKSIVQIATRWSTLKTAAFTGLMTGPMLFAGGVIGHREAMHTMLATQDKLILFPVVSQPQNLPFVVGTVAVPLALFCWMLGRWLSTRWIKRSGGDLLLGWARKKGLLMGFGSALLTILLAWSSATYFFTRWPLWMDRDGKLLGQFAVFRPPTMVEPPKPIPAKPERTKRSAKKPNADSR